MRRYLIVAAAAGGLLLLGGAPAYADVNPAPNGGPLGGLLDPAGGISLNGPLGDTPLLGVKPGDNTPALPTLPGTAATRPGSDSARPVTGATPTEGGLPAARTGLGGAKPAPAADVVGQSPLGESPLGDMRADSFSVANVPVGSVLNGGGLSSLGLMPDGSPAVVSRPAAGAADGTRPVAGARPVAGGATESGLLGSGVPLLGGLGGIDGLLTEPARTLPADVPDTTGMPAGGTTVDDADGTNPATDQPGGQTPAAQTPAGQNTAAPNPNGPGDDDKRLHEEPIDNEAGAGRAFSEGRPVAGQDPDFD